MAFLVNLTAYPVTLGLLPYVARDVYGTTQAGLGYLIAAVAAGGILGSLLLSQTGRATQPARMVLLFSLAWPGCWLSNSVGWTACWAVCCCCR